MLQITAYDPTGSVSEEILRYSFWEEMKDAVFLGARTEAEIEEFIANHKADVVLAVSEFKSFTRAEFIKKILTDYPYVYVVIISETDSYTEVRRAFLKGVFDYLVYDEKLEARLRHTLMRMTGRQSDIYFSEKIYDKVQNLSKHIFDGGDNVADIVHDIVTEIYSDQNGNDIVCRQVIEKVKTESYKNFVRKKPWLEKFIYRGDYIREIGFDIKSETEAEKELCRYYQEVDTLFKKYNVIDANKTVYLIGKSIIHQVDGKITLQSIADDVYLNKTYVSHIFKKVTGVSINDFVLDVKIDRAKTLLHYPDISVSEVAEILCFCNAGYFSSLFKRYAGITPSEYRKYIRNGDT